MFTPEEAREFGKILDAGNAIFNDDELESGPVWIQARFTRQCSFAPAEEIKHDGSW